MKIILPHVCQIVKLLDKISPQSTTPMLPVHIMYRINSLDLCIERRTLASHSCALAIVIETNHFDWRLLIQYTACLSLVFFIHARSIEYCCVSFFIVIFTQCIVFQFQILVFSPFNVYVLFVLCNKIWVTLYKYSLLFCHLKYRSIYTYIWQNTGRDCHHKD